ncbi:hypothetical protein CONPUDRAFT_138287 [Coniophora puteana RWD-64-598 SS2]|uniref:Phosphatidylserine decarboxylase n=1 Tax=Coniophora puteana (strain RWD-64-598) TaxID=741705 RepID=A0A5M3MJU7_CONPW|nr:uncharacterized protein CONPUDRAFT_138287 [Coniophora puteana RWD-64-598 SS2]EIW79074.1 hypothetical protein CONPUDRAFT_138287 [Coniophora puteana RWD-64-598 SS2]
MHHIHPSLVHGVQNVKPSNLKDANQDAAAEGLSSAVDYSHPDKNNGDVQQGIHGHSHLGALADSKWYKELVPKLESLASKHHVGNFVALRGTNETFFESMPIYARLGMHLLFYGHEQVKLLEGNSRIEELLKEQSIKEGKIYDSPESVKNIPSFIKTYGISLDELAEPDISKYKNFNEFFSRKMKPDARPVANADDPRGFCSAADCRLVVYPTVDLAQKFWIKGDEFSVPALLAAQPDPESPLCQSLSGGALAIFRLAPSDYHRFHSPIDAEVVAIGEPIPGQYYTVNPQAVNEPKMDVFSRNKRQVLILRHTLTGKEVAFIAIGALLVGSIGWTVQPGQQVKRGDELGFFAYGGSTCIAIFPPGLMAFDEDLVKNSEGRGVPAPALHGNGPIETYVKVGMSLGRMPEGA